MAYILTLLFMAPFITRKESRWFMVAYAFILLVAKEIRTTLEVIGPEFFVFNSYVYVACLCASVFFLEGTERKVSVLLFFLFSVYSVSIALWWGAIPISLYYAFGVMLIIAQTMVVSYKEKSFIKNTAMFLVAWFVGSTAS